MEYRDCDTSYLKEYWTSSILGNLTFLLRWKRASYLDGLSHCLHRQVPPSLPGFNLHFRKLLPIQLLGIHVLRPKTILGSMGFQRNDLCSKSLLLWIGLCQSMHLHGRCYLAGSFLRLRIQTLGFRIRIDLYGNYRLHETCSWFEHFESNPIWNNNRNMVILLCVSYHKLQ